LGNLTRVKRLPGLKGRNCREGREDSVVCNERIGKNDVAKLVQRGKRTSVKKRRNVFSRGKEGAGIRSSAQRRAKGKSSH